ncbi:MAG: DUF6364 family protein [bacterium]
MKNVTLSIEEDVLEAGREYAKRHNTSLNSLIRRLIKQLTIRSSNNWMDESFKIMDKAKVNSGGKKWNRKELYRV